jgi:glycosyltransferase involved in cell wall biosynthesis
MKILLANYRHFVSGGPERYMFNVIGALTDRGHQVIPFSINYRRNRPTPYSRYFVEPLGTRDEVTFREQQLNAKSLWRTLSRLFYAKDVERAVVRIVADMRPQVAYVLHYLRKLSPSLLVGLKRAGLPIVVRLSDYAMVCPQAHCLRDGHPCELCVKGNLWPSIRYRCIQHSLAASALNSIATWYHRYRRFFELIDLFVTTNQFMYDTMASAGFSKQRLRLVPTFVNKVPLGSYSDSVKDGHIIYAGRLEHIKGVHILLEALILLRRRRPDLKIELNVVGGGDEAYSVMLKKKTEEGGLDDALQFLGELSIDPLLKLMSKSQLSVVPSLFYENLPNAILESYACGTPVLASDSGSLRECVRNGVTGYLFEPGNAGSLAERLEYCLDHPQQLEYMSLKAREVAEDVYSPQRHSAILEELFSELVGVRK